MYSLSNLLGCRIVSIYPNTISPCVSRNFFNKTILAIENKFPNTFLPIMWTHMTNVKLAGWSPNHFVPYVKKVFVKAKATLHGNVNPNRKCQNKEGQKKLHSFYDYKKKIKIPKEVASKRTESNKTKVFKRKETNENVTTSKENKDKVIKNKDTKDKAFNCKADDEISKSKETLKKPFSESDTDKSDSPKKKKKLIAINSNVLLCINQDSIVNGVKSGNSLKHAKKILIPSSVLFAVKRKAVHIKVNS